MISRSLSALITFIATLLLLIIACSDEDDTPVDSGGLEPLPSLLGEYKGEYIYVDDYGTANDTSTWDVIFRFSDQNYWMFDKEFV